MFYKAYILEHEKVYANTDMILDGNSWYDSDRIVRICKKYMELVAFGDRLKSAVTNADRTRFNKEIKNAMNELTECTK